MKLLNWFDSWVVKGPFTPRDLGIYRVIYGILVLFYLPRLQYLGDLPASLYDPPTGPLKLLSAFPATPVLVGIEVVTAILAVMTLIGLFTRTASIALMLILMLGFGLTFSLGKIDHLILLMIIPGILAFARWGDTCSVDALRRERAGMPVAPVSRSSASQLQWPLRFLSVSIGIAFVTAVLPKITNGWLNPTTQASFGYQVKQDFIRDFPGGISAALIKVHLPILWEVLDWATVVVELGIVFCVVSWLVWRIGISVLMVFHLSVALSLGILFTGNVIAYGAFVSWGLLRLPSVTLSAGTKRTIVLLAPVIALVGGTVVFFIGDSLWSVRSGVSFFLVYAGSVVAIVYLVRRLLRLPGALRDRNNPPPTPPDPGGFLPVTGNSQPGLRER